MIDLFVLKCVNAIRQLLDDDQMVSFMAKDNSVDDAINGKLTFRISPNTFTKPAFDDLLNKEAIFSDIRRS